MARTHIRVGLQEKIASESGLTRRIRAPRMSKSEMLAELRLIACFFEAMRRITPRDIRIARAVLEHATLQEAGKAIAPERENYAPYMSRRIRRMRDSLHRALLDLGSSPNSSIGAPREASEPDTACRRLRTGQLLPKDGGERDSPDA